MTVYHRNDTVYDYGEGFAGTTLNLSPEGLANAKSLADVLNRSDDG